MHANFTSQYDMLYLLLQLGADPYVKTSQNRTVADMVKDKNGRGIQVLGLEKEQGGWYNKDGKFSDSPYNREYFERRVRKDIQDEQNQVTPEYDWKRAWRVSFESWEISQENPKQKKYFVIRLRREAGLPIWPFMLK